MAAKKGLSGLYLLLILFGLMVLFGGPALVRMINIILFGQCNIAPEANKIQETIKKVCQGPVGDFEYVDYPSCPVIMSCSSCAVALRNAAFRSTIGLLQAQGFAQSVTATGRSFWNIGRGAWHAPQTLINAKNFVGDFRYGLSGGEWKRVGNWWNAYQYAKASGTYRNMLRAGRIVTATRNLPLWKEVASLAYAKARNALLGRSPIAGASDLIRRSPTTYVYVLVANDPNKPDIQDKVAGLADSVAAKIEPILADQEGTIVVPIGLDVHLKVLKTADADGRLKELATEGTATLGEANTLLFDLNTHLNVLFTNMNDGVYANSQFGQGSCLQPSSTAFNAVPSNYEQVAGACTFTSTVVTQEPEDCEQVDPDCKSNCALKEPKCAKPDTFEDQNKMVEESVSVILRRNHAFRFLDDAQGFLTYRIEEVEKKTADAAGKAAIAAAKTNINKALDEAREDASLADDSWSFAYLAVGRIAEYIDTVGQYESKAGITDGARGWYTTAIDTMNSVDELIFGKWSYKKDAGGNLVRDKLLADGLEQKQVALLKIRNEAYDILLKSSCAQKTAEIDDVAFPSGSARITVPLCALISSCNQDDRLLSQTGGCILGAPNLEKERVRVTMCDCDRTLAPNCEGGQKCDATHPAIGEVYFSLPAIPISPIDYGTTVKSLGVTIGLVSGLVGGEAGRALATSAFAVQNCLSSNPLNTLIFCMKPASVQCVLPGGCEVCFSAKCNTRISCSAVGAANLRVEKKKDGGGIATEVTGPVKPI